MKRPVEPIILMIALFINIVWATNSGTLPGEGKAEGVIWACLYIGLYMFYSQVSLGERRSARSLLRRLWICLLLAVASLHVFKLLVSQEIWRNVFYLRYISIPAFIGIYCAMLLPVETNELYRSAKASRIVAPLVSLSILLIFSAFFVSLMDLFVQISVTSGYNIKHAFIQRNSWITSILIIFSAYTLAYSATSKISTALLFISPFYLALGIANLEKWKYMHAFVTPLDLYSLPEFLPQFKTFFGSGILVATICGVFAWVAGIVVLRRVPPKRIPFLFRLPLGVFSLVMLLSVPVLHTYVDRSEKIISIIGSPLDFRTKDFKNGYLLNFLAETPLLFLPKPPNYSPTTVVAASKKYLLPEPAQVDHNQGRRVNLIIYMLESFIDPENLGWHYTVDPLPEFHLLEKVSINGHAYVPEEYGASATTEFEVLTGMSTIFYPYRTLPYRQLVLNQIPSLPKFLKNHGYRTIAVQADPKNFYNREKAYSLMGFDEVVWLNENPNVERAAQGVWVSDRAIVESVIRASEQSHPFFIFAFPSSTHSPYHHNVYRKSELDVLGLPPGPDSDEIKYYINALRVADKAFGTLIEHFRGRPDPTVIAILGDHIPPLTQVALRLFNEKLSTLPESEKYLMSRRVPFLVWANFDIPRENMELSVNSVPSYLLEKMGIPPHGFLAVSDAVRRKLPILKRYVRRADGSTRGLDSLTGEERDLIADYWLLQHDLLNGEHYSIRGSASDRMPAIR